MVWQMNSALGEGKIPVEVPSWATPFLTMFLYSTIMIGYPIIVVGLLQEIRRPTLDFRFHRNWRWVSAGVFLLGIFALVNIYQLIDWSWDPNLPVRWFFSSFCMETSSFALLFGILFMTRSTPQKSPSYRTMLIGVVLFQIILPMLTYALAAVGIYYGGPVEYKNFWTETVATLWFWWDFLSELVILVGAIWLLRRGKK